MIQYLGEQFRAGGEFMWVILVVFAFAFAVVLERLWFYFFVCRGDAGTIVARLAKEINASGVDAAQKILVSRVAPVSALLGIALDRLAEGLSHEEVREAVEEAAIKEVPRLAKRLNYLQLLANIATLLGLLGTILGLQVCFSSLGAVDASQKASLLSSGIAQAMNCTAFGLIVAVICMVVYTMFHNRHQALLTDLDHSLVRFLSFVKKREAA